jgi:hypothetical protein
MKVVHIIASVLVWIGGINWGLVGVSENWNVVNAILGSVPSIERLVYVLVGLSALYLVFTHGKCCKTCESKDSVATM